MKPIVAIGTQDFEKIRKNNIFYIDKTHFISEWWKNNDDVTLITRPRRFGKTLNLSMLKYFFSNQCKDRGSLFQGLSVWDNEEYHSLQGSYPVISLTFADVKGTTFETARNAIIQKLIKLYSTHSYIKTDEILVKEDWDYINSLKKDMADDTASVAVNYLSDYMSRFFHKKVLIFLDEYDTPLQEAYLNGYWDELAAFIRSLFNSTFKTNEHLERALLTGITRIGKESIFSDINNLEVVTTTSEKYAASFGFTTEEITKALEQFGLSGNLKKVKFWYDGFRFGSQKDIYNPWSITKYLDSQKFEAYWANTSSNGLVSRLIQEGSADTKMAMEDLLAGKSLCTQFDEQIVFSQLGRKESALWSLLLAGGYLRIKDSYMNKRDQMVYELVITNHEVTLMFEQMAEDWFSDFTPAYNNFIKALLSDDRAAMNLYMNRVAFTTFSYFDTGKHPSGATEPERFYHGFVLGLMVDLADKYSITSNRESGFGRYDVILEPLHDKDDAIIMEFKVRSPDDGNTLADTVQKALEQIECKKYSAILEAKGFAPERIRKYGIAFEGKTVLIG